MKLLERNDKQGNVTLLVDDLEDLWYLHTIIDAGDTCSGDSEYKEKLSGTMSEGKSQSVRRRVYLTIAVERSEFAHHTGQLRIMGKVIGGSDAVPRGSHHSLDVVPGDRITLAKAHWLDYQREKLDEALSARSSAIVLLFDRESAIISLLTPTGHKTLLTLKGDVPRKGVDEAKQHTFYRDVVKQLDELATRHATQHVIAASPSFWREYLERELSPELRKKVVFASCSTVDESAIGELLVRPELQAALHKQRSARESQLIGELLEALARDKLAYGFVDVQAAVAAGNISQLVITERAITKAREEETFKDIELLMRAASDMKAAVRLLSTEEAMQKIDGLGGIVGMKRW